MIRTKPPSDEYRDGWDRVFGDKPSDEFKFIRGPEWSGCPSCREMIPSHRGVFTTHYLDGKQCEWSGRRLPASGAALKVTAVDANNGVVTLGPV